MLHANSISRTKTKLGGFDDGHDSVPRQGLSGLATNDAKGRDLRSFQTSRTSYAVSFAPTVVQQRMSDKEDRLKDRQTYPIMLSSLWPIFSEPIADAPPPTASPS